MKHYFIFFSFVLVTSFAIAQTRQQDSIWNIYLNEYKKHPEKQIPRDTVYRNKYQHQTTKSKATYYRISYPIGSYYIVNSYYMNGTLKMEALCDSSGAGNGPCIYYHPNGDIESSGQFEHNKPVGKWYSYNSKGEPVYSEHFRSASDPKPYVHKSWIPENQSSLFLWNISYRYKLNKGILSSGHGWGIELGLNPGYLISQKLLLGVFGGWGMRDILYPTRFENSYLKDFNAEFDGTTLSGNDSVVVNYMASVMQKKGYFHELNVYGGVMIKLPYDYMPVIKVYTGTSGFLYKTLSKTVQLKPYDPSHQGYDNDYLSIERRLAWGLEVFLYNGRTKVREYDFTYAQKKKWRWSYNLFALSVYVEQFNTSNTRFTYSDGVHDVDVKMSSFMSPAFMNRHKKDYNIGLRLSLGSF